MDSQSSFNVAQYWQICKRRWMPALAVFLAISTLGIVNTAMKVNIYEAEAKLKLQKNSANSFLTNISEDLELLAPLVEKNNLINTEVEIIQSRPIIKKTIKDLDLKNERDNRLKTQSFLDNLKVSVIPSTDVLRVTYQHPNPVIATKVVNALIANYIDSNITASKLELLEAKKTLEQQILKTKKDLLETETSIKKIKDKNQILSPKEEVSRLSYTIGDVEKQITETRSEIANLNRQSEYVKEKLNMSAQQVLEMTNVSQSPAVQQIFSQLKQLESQLNQEKSLFAGKNPQIVVLSEKLKLQKQLLAKQLELITSYSSQPEEINPQFAKVPQELAFSLIELEATIAGLTKQLAYLSEIETELKNKAAGFPEIEQDFKQLQRELAVFQRTYDLLQDQLSMIDVAVNQNINNVRVIAYATRPETPINSRGVGYLLSISLGLIGALGTVCILESRDNSLRSVKKAKQLFGYNLLGSIPTYDKSQSSTLPSSEDLITPPLLVRDNPGSSVSESYRMLQSNLRSLNDDCDVQSVVVTSSVSGEGKSTVAANLAGAMAQVGHKVLLVDADLHSPTQQQIWNTYSDYGLKNLLADNLDFRLATETVMQNLSIVTSGGISASPAILLDSFKMKDLIDYWSRVYDFIIIDTPSLSVAADAPILGKIADGIILVVKPEEINHSQAEFAKETLENSGQKVLGVVFNSVDPKIDASGHYYSSLENQQNVLPEAKLLASTKEEFWDSILRISQESPKVQLDSTSNTQQLLDTPTDKLEESVDYLQQDLEKLSALVKEQEDELFVKRQTVRKMQRKLNLAPTADRPALEKKLAQEQENKQMLDETLIGQRRNLARKRQILRQYQDILAVKQA